MSKRPTQTTALFFPYPDLNPYSMITTPSRSLHLNSANLPGSRFVGVTGITRPQDAAQCIQVFREYVADRVELDPISLAIGLLTTPGKLFGNLSGANRYLTLNQINACCIRNPRALNIIHLCCKDPSRLGLSLRRIKDFCQKIHGIQLNVPNLGAQTLRTQVENAYSGMKIEGVPTPLFLSVGLSTLRACGWRPDVVANYVSTFITGGVSTAPLIDRVIIDPSEENGLCVNPETILPILQALRARFSGLPLICSGGLSEETVPSVLPSVISQIDHLSVDAEGGLRTSDDQFDPHAAGGYIKRVLDTLRVQPQS